MKLLLLSVGILAIAMMTGACASSTGRAAVPRPFPGGPTISSRKNPAPPPAAQPEAQPDTALAEGSSAPVALIPSLADRRYDGRAVAEYALAFQGVPYRFGGADPAGFDCSGLVQYVFAQYGIYVPRVVEEQWQVGDKIKKPREIKPGDLLFFSTKGSGATHVGIALDADRFVHAPNSSGVVRVEALSSAYWGSHYLGARRLGSPS